MRPVILFSLLLSAATRAVIADGGTAWVTPHDSYSSSVGVLGCKINTNRVAYWPGSVDCNNLCVQLTYEGRSVKLLRIDQSGGAHDVSYDAWNYLYTGKSAKDKPTTGGAIAMEYTNLAASECASLINTSGHKLPLSASNSMNFLASCLEQPNSWVAKNYILYNILDSVCSWGYDEKCSLDWPDANQATCSHGLGQPVVLTSAPVYNIQYGTGKSVLASTSQTTTTTSNDASANVVSGSGRNSEISRLAMLGVVITAIVYPIMQHL